LYRFLAITVLLDVKDIPQVGPLQRGRINHCDGCFYAVMHIAKNPTADPRATKHCSPHGRVFKLIDLDTETGAFTGLGKNAAASMQFFL
jgi:hypothetical protein